MKGCLNYLSIFCLTALTSILLACGGGGSSDGEWIIIRPPAVLTPQEVDLPQAVVSIAAGHSSTCAITTSGETYCWGDNEYGQLGSEGADEECDTGLEVCSSTPLLLSTPISYSDLSNGHTYSCGLETNGIVSCWGQPPIGPAPWTPDITPKPLPGNIRFQSISAGDISIGICGIADDEETYCLGVWDFLGFDGPDYLTVPVAVSNGLHFIKVQNGESHACGLTALGDIYCWGDNWFGQLGVPAEQSGGIPYSIVPIAAGTGITWKDLAVGGSFNCGLTEDGLTYCWGAIGWLSDELIMAAEGHLPFPVSTDIHFDKIFTGGYADKACGLKDTGEAYCWGAFGPLGDGTYEGSHIPVQVVGNLSFTTLAVGGIHICGIENSGKVYCWGDNSHKATGSP